MKNIKSVLAVIVAVCLMMCLAVPAFATAETTVATTAATTEATEAAAETTEAAAETTEIAETLETVVVTEPPLLFEEETVSSDSVIDFDDLQDAAGIEEEHNHDHEEAEAEAEVGFKKVLRVILTVLEVIASIALVAVVLMQSGKESGLSGALSGNSDSYMSRNGKGTLDKKLAAATKWVALVWVLLTLALFLL